MRTRKYSRPAVVAGLGEAEEGHTDPDICIQGVMRNGIATTDSNEQMPSPTPSKNPPSSSLPDKLADPKEGVSPDDAQIPDDQDANLTGAEKTHQATNDEDIVGPDSNRG
jgi:hypothetical protein